VVHGIAFRNIWALGQPPLAESTLSGDVHDVIVDNLKYEQHRVASDAEVPLAVMAGAEQPKFTAAPALTAAFRIDPANARVHQKLTFTAQEMPGAKYVWLFGDGTEAHGRRVRHRFADTLGTELDGANGAGVFRVLLHVTDKAGHQDWAEQNVAVTDQLHEPITDSGKTAPGLTWKVYDGTWTELPDFTKLTPVFTGESPNFEANAQGFTRWATTWGGFLKVPADGSYIFHLIDRDGARLVIDGVEVAKTGPPFAQVCGSPGNALRYDRGAIGLRAGMHSIHIEALNTMSGDAPRLMWEGPGVGMQVIPAGAVLHRE
jgi:PA14 domain/PKD domain